VDVSKAAVARARARGVEALVADFDAGPLPAASGSFDVALCLDVLEHLFDPRRAITEIHRALAPRGRLLVAVPNGLNLFNRVAFLSGRPIDVMDKAHLSGEPFSEHVRFFSLAVLERFLADGGFLPVERLFFFPDRLTDARFRVGSWLARGVTGLRLQERAPAWFALAFLFVCERRG
jgi:SAM-dependent methyltransferase